MTLLVHSLISPVKRRIRRNTKPTGADEAKILRITIIDCFHCHLYLLQWRHVCENNLLIIKYRRLLWAMTMRICGINKHEILRHGALLSEQRIRDGSNSPKHLKHYTFRSLIHPSISCFATRARTHTRAWVGLCAWASECVNSCVCTVVVGHVMVLHQLHTLCGIEHWARTDKI